jgi:tetratricopeptide (TPR) repeat protein
MIFILIQLFSAQIDSALQEYNASNIESSYDIVFSIPIDSTEGFEYYEILELRGLVSKRMMKLNQAQDIYREVIQCEYESILHKAYINYADVHYYMMNFERRIYYLQKAYNLEPTNKVIRNIARHHFQIRGDYESAKIWIDRHPVNNEMGYNLLLAEFNESKRRYKDSYDYYRKAKVQAKSAGLFNYEHFASVGQYRTERLISTEKEESFQYWLEKLIILLIVYIMVKKIPRNNERINQYTGEVNQ